MKQFKILKLITNKGKEIIPHKINVIVGPNNNGKSRFLKDIKMLITTLDENTKVIKQINIEIPSDFDEFIKEYKLNEKILNLNGQQYLSDYSGVSQTEFNSSDSFANNLSAHLQPIYSWENVVKSAIDYSKSHINIFSNKTDSMKNFLNFFGILFVQYLGTEEKLLTCKTQKKYGRNDLSKNILSEVQTNSTLLSELAKYTKKMFHKDVILDAVNLGEKIAFRVGSDFDFYRNAKKIDTDADKKLNDYELLDTEGDGIKSFVSTFITLNMSQKNIILLDEPESFLHPPLASQMGKIIAEAASDDKQIFVATHSPELLKSLIENCDDVNIIRIERENQKSNIYQLNNKDFLKCMYQSSLLSNSRVLNGLFCEKTYICESLSDLEIFQLLHDTANPTDSAYFINAYNKQTEEDISNLNKTLNVKNYRIYDFDIFREDLTTALNHFVDQKDISRIMKITDRIRDDFKSQIPEQKDEQQFKKILKNKYYNEGIRGIKDKNLLQNTLKEMNFLKKAGIIVLPNGCLETTLEELGIKYTRDNKGNWFSKASQKLIKSSKQDIVGLEIYRWIFEEDYEI